MEAHVLLKLLQEQPVVIPRKLFTESRRLGLSPLEFSLVAHLIEMIGEGIHMPLPSELGERLSVSEAEARAALLRSLQKELVAIDADEDGERYSLLPLFAALDEQPEKAAPPALNEGIIHAFEREFGNVTPFEIEQIVGWFTVDGYPEELILAALREAKLRNVRSLKYIDKILRAWEEQHIKSLEDLVEFQRRRK